MADPSSRRKLRRDLERGRSRLFPSDGGQRGLHRRQLGRKAESLEKWQKVLGEDPSWSAESFEKWYKLWNIRDEDSAKLMECIYKTGVLGPEAKPGR